MVDYPDFQWKREITVAIGLEISQLIQDAGENATTLGAKLHQQLCYAPCSAMQYISDLRHGIVGYYEEAPQAHMSNLERLSLVLETIGVGAEHPVVVKIREISPTFQHPYPQEARTKQPRLHNITEPPHPQNQYDTALADEIGCAIRERMGSRQGTITDCAFNWCLDLGFSTPGSAVGYLGYVRRGLIYNNAGRRSTQIQNLQRLAVVLEKCGFQPDDEILDKAELLDPDFKQFRPQQVTQEGTIEYYI